MTGVRCRSCGRLLHRPTPDGYGPVCRRARLAGDPYAGARGLRPTAGDGQLAIPVAQLAPSTT